MPASSASSVQGGRLLKDRVTAMHERKTQTFSIFGAVCSEACNTRCVPAHRLEYSSSGMLRIIGLNTVVRIFASLTHTLHPSNIPRAPILPRHTLHPPVHIAKATSPTLLGAQAKLTRRPTPNPLRIPSVPCRRRQEGSPSLPGPPGPQTCLDPPGRGARA